MIASFTHAYQAMNSPFTIRIDLTSGAERLNERIQGVFTRMQMETEVIEQCLSRFRKDSELSQLNSRIGQKVRISPLLKEVLRLADDAFHSSRQLFDPRVIVHLERLGYKGVMEHPTERAAGDVNTLMTARPLIIWHDEDFVEVSAPLDLGGIGKGYTVDFLSRRIQQDIGDLVTGYLVNAGGDVIVYGSQDNGDPWTVGVEDPFDITELIAALTIRDECVAVCTSSRARRKWEYQGETVHHLIDPRSGHSANHSFMAVTVLAPMASLAEVITKTVFIDGPICEDSIYYPDARYLYISENRELYCSSALKDELVWVNQQIKEVHFF